MKNVKLHTYLLVIGTLFVTQALCAAGAGAGAGAGTRAGEELRLISPEEAYNIGKHVAYNHWKDMGIIAGKFAYSRGEMLERGLRRSRTGRFDPLNTPDATIREELRKKGFSGVNAAIIQAYKKAVRDESLYRKAREEGFIQGYEQAEADAFEGGKIAAQ